MAPGRSGDETAVAREPDLLRFTTAGSVDDGKSTLIGRLLHDAGAIYEDQLAALRGKAPDPGAFLFTSRPPRPWSARASRSRPRPTGRTGSRR